jgi:hypothetical protein
MNSATRWRSFEVNPARVRPSDHPFENWGRRRLNFFELAFERDGRSVDRKVIEATLGGGQPWRRLRHLIRMNVEAKHPTVFVGKILDEEFWHPMLVFVGHGQR